MTDRGAHRSGTAAALMFQGTGSDVGKSVIVAGLCRAYTNRGLRVRPFKPQNMSNNAAVTPDGGEIGRAQALQARACRVAASVHMNPVLLKPQSEIGAQVVVLGRVLGHATAREFQSMKQGLLPAVVASFERLREEADVVLIEGAGSCAEVNLRANDIANMGFARAAGVPVILIGDIDRGGVIAQIAGTKTVLDPADADLIVGFLVNKFRGDPSLFQAGMDLITSHTGWPGFGLIPYFPDAGRLPAEDVVALDRRTAAGAVVAAATGGGTDAAAQAAGGTEAAPQAAGGTEVAHGPRAKCVVAVPRLAHIANFDDLDPLRLEPALQLIIVHPGQPLPAADLVILPGSKATLADLDDFRNNGWDIDLRAHVRRGGRVLGLCGGYQMLGRTVSDPEGVEGPPGSSAGLGLLDVETVLSSDKRLTEVTGTSLPDGVPFRGYEMHVGRTEGPDRARPLLRFADGGTDGACSADGRVRATYVHGMFTDDRQRAAWLAWLGHGASGVSYDEDVDRVLDALAAHLERHVDLDRLLRVGGTPR